MRAIEVLCLFCIATLLPPTNAGGTCEKVENENWGGSIGTVKTCYMDSTAINSKDFSITSDRDETVKGFRAHKNKNLMYLPNNLGSKFPNLIVLFAQSCSIKEIRKNNFEGFNKLWHLYLSYNQIEKIDDDTFEDIPEVEIIQLYSNKIKKLNGRAFASLHKLIYVYLGSNECINENFIFKTSIAEIPRILTEKCGFVDSEPSSTTTAEPEADLMAQSEELQALKLEMAKLRIEKAKADLQVVQLKEICDARI